MWPCPNRSHHPRTAPLSRAAGHHADAVDQATPGRERRKAWTRFVPSFLVALAEGFLRDTLINGAWLFSVIVAVIGVTSGEVAWAVAGVAAGITGVALVVIALARRWSFGRQWAVIVGVLVLQLVLAGAFFSNR